MINGQQFASISNVDFTESGSCLEINDDASLIQQVQGPIGRLVVVLDLNTEHYLDSTEADGVYITLRMQNETIANKGFGFTVSPGEEVLINIDSVRSERLVDPWGDCQNNIDVLNSHMGDENHLTLKECFLLQKLWSYFRDDRCNCFPWYFWQRYLISRQSKRYDEELINRMLRFLSQEIAPDTQIQLNRTCIRNATENVDITDEENILIVMDKKEKRVKAMDMFRKKK